MKKPNGQDTDLSRRQFIINSTGAGFAALLLACGVREITAESFINTAAPFVDGAAICALTPQKEEGPFFIEGANIRKNIREDSAGKNLLLRMQVVDVDKCQPIQNAVVNIWHCSAEGVYSGYETMNLDGGFPPNGAPPQFGNGHEKGMMPPPRDGMRPPPNGDNRRMPPPPRDGQRMPPPNGMPPGGNGGGMHAVPTSPKRFLRGVQITDADGQVEFETVYPGWYEPRAVHIHTKIFLNDREMLTSQMFFPETLNDRIFTTVEPYKTRGVNPNKTGGDPVAGADPPLLTIVETKDLITGTIVIGVKSA